MARTAEELIAQAHGSADWHDRRLAVIALGYRDDPEILPVLLTCLQDPVSEVQHAAIIALGRRGDRVAMQELLRPKILGSSEANVRWAATSALGKLGDHRVIDQLVRMVDDEEWLVSNEAIEVLRAKVAEIIEAQDLRLARILIRMLNLPDPELVELAKGGLERLGSDATPILCDALGSVWEAVRRHAATVCGLVRDPAMVDSLVTALGDERPSVRREAALALGEIGDHRGLRPLISVLGDFDGQVRKGVVDALVALGVVAVEPLCIALEHAKSKQARCAALEALGVLGDGRAIPILVHCLGSSYHLVRLGAIVALGRFGRAVVEPLLGILSYNRSDISYLMQEVTSSSDVQTRVRAAKALGDLEDHRAVEALKAQLSDPNREVALAAQEALEKIGCAAWARRGAATVLGRVGDRRVTPEVLVLLDDDSVNVRRAAVRALGGLEASEHTARLAVMARRDPERLVRRAALNVLRDLDPATQELFATALEALIDDAADVRARAARIAGTFIDQRAIEPLLARLSDPSWNVRLSAETALSSQGKPAVPGLLVVLREGTMIARRRAASALGRIGDPQAIGTLETQLEFERDSATRDLIREALLELRN